MRPHKAPRNAGSTSRPLKLTPGIARFGARDINCGFAGISPVLEIVAITTGARAPYMWRRDRESSIRSLEFQSLIAFSGAASSAAGAAAVMGWRRLLKRIPAARRWKH